MPDKSKPQPEERSSFFNFPGQVDEQSPGTLNEAPTEQGQEPSASQSPELLPLNEGGEAGEQTSPTAESASPPQLPTDHETLLEMGLENEKGRWLGDDEPPWVGLETDTYYITNWSGYRNYHCKWHGCLFAIVSGRPTTEFAIEDHARGHRAIENVHEEDRIQTRRQRFGLVDPLGDPL